MDVNELKKLPKIELHCHLDGSLSQSFIEQRLQRKVAFEELSVGDDCQSLVDYLQKFDLPCSCLMDKDGMEGAGYDVLRTMHEENICYAEIRFAPLLSVSENFETAEVIEALLSGLSRGRKEFGVEYNVITCAMRHHSLEDNLKMIKVSREFLGSGVCAADLAGAEAMYPMSEFMDLFWKTKQMGMPFTIHAGECGSAQNILDALHAGAKRIGHGIAMRMDASVREKIRNAGIGIEMCPISNLQTKAVQNKAEYPMRMFLDEGLLVSVNTDNRTVSHTSMTKELAFVQNNYGITDEEIIRMQKNALITAFADDGLKHKLSKLMI